MYYHISRPHRQRERGNLVLELKTENGTAPLNPLAPAGTLWQYPVQTGVVGEQLATASSAGGVRTFGTWLGFDVKRPR